MLTQGVNLHQEKGVFAATDVALLGTHQLTMTIHQGVYHQVKRMIAAVGNKVEKLHRHQIGQLVLPEIEEGIGYICRSRKNNSPKILFKKTMKCLKLTVSNKPHFS